jgi:hypothetical protein
VTPDHTEITEDMSLSFTCRAIFVRQKAVAVAMRNARVDGPGAGSCRTSYAPTTELGDGVSEEASDGRNGGL